MSRAGSRERAGDVLERNADVLVARIASGRARASTSAKSARLASTFSKIASMITSARAMPSPATSGIRRSSASRARRGSRRRSANSFAARFIAGARRCGVLVLQRHGEAAQRAPRGDVAAHRAGADDVHVRRPAAPRRLPSAFRRSCSWNTRIRLAAVGVAQQRRRSMRGRRRRAPAHRRRSAPTDRGSRRARDSARAARASRPACAPSPR